MFQFAERVPRPSQATEIKVSKCELPFDHRQLNLLLEESGIKVDSSAVNMCSRYLLEIWSEGAGPNRHLPFRTLSLNYPRVVEHRGSETFTGLTACRHGANVAIFFRLLCHRHAQRT